MEEKSIKIIEVFCENFRNTQKSIDKLWINYWRRRIQAIENLIARYKELEETLEKYKYKEIGDTDKIIEFYKKYKNF